MSYTKPSKSTGYQNIALKDTAGGVLYFVEARTAHLTDTNARGIYLYNNEPYYWNGTTTTAWGSGGGGGGVPTWESIFGADSTFTITPDATFTIAGNRSTATDVVTFTNVAGGSGSVIQITNSGSGNDIDGTSNTWGVSKAGAASFLTLTLTGTTITSTGADLAWAIEDNDATALSIGCAGETDMMVFDTRTGAETVTFNNNLNMTDGNATFVSTSNTVTNILVTNNTVTTFGADASSAGVVCIRSTSLTTGSLLQLQLSDTALNGGYYLTCRESIGGTNDFTIGENGVMTIAGAGGATAFTVTAGDVIFSDASLAITDADNAATFTVTNNTATTASVIVLAGSGAFTGSTTTSFATLTASGLTSGTVLYIPAAALTTGKIIDIVSTSATDASFITLTGNTANQTTTGKMINIDLVANVAAQGLKIATTGIYTGTDGLVDLDVGAMTTGVMLALTSTTGLTSGSLIRATTATAGAIATNGAYSFVGTGDFTVGAVGLGMFHVAANSTVAGTVASISGTALTTGVGLHIASTGTGMTSGSLLRATTGTTGAVATNGVISIRATGAYTSTSNAGLLDVQASAAAGAATLVNIKATNGSQTAVTALNIEQTTTTTGYTGDFVRIVGTSTTGDCNLVAITSVSTTAGDALSITNNALTLGTGTLLNLVHGTSVIGAGSSMLRITSTGVDTGTTTGTLLDLAATAATSATLVLLTSATLDSGKGISLVLNGLTTGEGMHISHTTSVIADGGSMLRVQSTGVDTGGATNGTVLDLIGSGQQAGVCVLETFSALTTGVAHKIVVNALTTGSGLLVTSSGTITNAGEGLVNIVGTGITTGDALKIDLTEATLNGGNYINCYDDTGAASVFKVAEDGITTIAGSAALTAALTLTAGDFKMSDGLVQNAVSATITADVGSAQGGNPITRFYNEISVCANAGDSITLPAAVAGRTVIVTNHGAQAADLFPASGDAINEGAADAATSIAVNETVLCIAYDATNWEVVQLARNT